MNASMWSQASLPEETWTTAPASDHSTLVQPSGNEWRSHGQPVTSQDLHALDTAAWLNVSQGPVELGLSPALSHESQSTHTLNTISEPELPLLPPGLDLSFISEPSWDVSGPVVYSSSHVPQDFSASAVTSPQDMSSGYTAGFPQPGYNGPSGVCEPQQPLYYFQGSQAPIPRRSVSDPAIVPQRPLLPRTDAQQMLSVHVPGHYAAPHVHPSAGPSDSGRVSSVASLPEHTGVHGPTFVPFHGPSAHSAHMVAPGHTLISPRPDHIHGPGFVSDHPSEEFGSFIRYDQDEKTASAASLSYAPVYGPSLPPAKVLAPGDAKPLAALPEQEVSTRHQAVSSSSSSGEGDEGRYRNHPLYSEGPQPDGLYHCPFKSDPNCQHKPTKLKCNYDKFIDSHLKPFRCKIEACSKQEFSSTACLLRHEREAHGMHGHGERPHLCYYPGCERGILGNGFPRRYNLFDHMKRVHDHKEDPAMATQDSQGARKGAGRKRKAPSSVSSEPAARRAKVQQPTPEMEVPAHAYAPQAPAYPEYHARQEPMSQRNLYSQWNQQKELLEFQMATVKSPEDVASLQYLSQNVEELRRLSQQARHG